LEAAKSQELSKMLMQTLQGVSPLVSREIAHFANRGAERTFADMNADQRERLSFYLGNLITSLQSGGGTPTMVLEPTGRPRDFSYIPIHQYGVALLTKEYPDYSELLDAFYARRDLMERMKQRSADLLRVLANTSDRIARKLAYQREELKECANRDQLRMKGDLLNASLNLIQKGDRKAVIPNLYDPAGGEVEIDLEFHLTPSQNAQRYYALYRKADTAEKMLRGLIESGEQELLYVDSVFDALTRADTEADLEAIRRELAGGGYVRRQTGGKQKKEAPLLPLRYRSMDGFAILSGRNNVQNDKLTLKDSHNYDLWLHTQKIPGSHTVILAEGREIPKSTIEQACIIAAYNSKARESAKVPVDFTQIRHVKKPGGARPGMVIYDHFQTVIVDPDEELVMSLREK
jgi:predicted ribosome quality control (RQC) complex YloA/Tae2 family protein